MFWIPILKNCHYKHFNWIIFYLQPLPNPNSDLKSWYSITPIGQNTLAKIIQNIFRKGCIPGYKTNHSLLATVAFNMFHAGVPENIIQ